MQETKVILSQSALRARIHKSVLLENVFRFKSTSLSMILMLI